MDFKSGLRGHSRQREARILVFELQVLSSASISASILISWYQPFA